MNDRRLRSLSGRDQAVSAFSTILLRLVDGTDAVSAALVDTEGETVDYAGTLDPFDIKVCAAEWRLVLRFLHECGVPHWNETRELLIRGARASYAVVALSEGYAVVLQLPTHSFAISFRAVAEAVRDLEREAGLGEPPRAGEEQWVRVDVRTSSPSEKRPQAIWVDGGWTPVEILGHYCVNRREMGYRARLPNGAELTLVREPLGRWWADVVPAGATASRAPQPDGEGAIERSR